MRTSNNTSDKARWLTVAIFGLSLVLIVALAKSAVDFVILLFSWMLTLCLSFLMLYMASGRFNPSTISTTIKWNPNRKKQRVLIRQMFGLIAIIIAAFELLLLIAWHMADFVYATTAMIAVIIAMLTLVTIYSRLIKKADVEDD